MKWVGVVALIILAALILTMCSYCNRAVGVVAKEVDPQVLQQKYEWFKNIAATLDAKLATIKLYKENQVKLKELYGEPVEWPKDVRDNEEQSRQEFLGVRASYNTLAAEYNAQMAKWNWRFCNVGELPKGYAETLPREFRSYEE